MKYKEMILAKSGLNETSFDLILQKLYEKMAVLNEEIIKKYRKEAGEVMDRIDPDDTQFIAAALATHSDIWSDDLHFQKQKKIKVLKTKDLVSLV